MANHYSSEQLSNFPWCVSTDTLRTEDLLVRFWETAEQLHAIKFSGHPFAAQHPALVQRLETLAGADANLSDWNDAVASDCLEQLSEILQDYAPVGFDFAVNEGDGACLGFWLTEEWAEALETLGLDDCDPTGWAALISELDLDGIDPDNVDDAYQGRAEGYSEDKAGADYAEQLAYETGAAGVDWGGQGAWPLNYIDWDGAWRELQMGDGYRLHDIGGGEWLVFRSV